MMNERSGDGIRDSHEHDLVMPGFRFHPTEEELIEFYLRRKVEGKKFNVELITFLDLYRYDPWELPAMAAIGEKEWFFYVPRDRKYRNGDRPNRVTASGYWKATGADRMIRAENNRPIGLKKTLVFYSGKAPKGIRSSWIMNEYRLPPIDIERYQKAEISLCRVYKRTGVEDHSAPSPIKASSSRNGGGPRPERKHASANSPPDEATPLQGENFSTPMTVDKGRDVLPVSSALNTMTNLNTATIATVPQPPIYGSTVPVTSLSSTPSTDEDGPSIYHSKNSVSLGSTYSLINVSHSSTMVSNPNMHDDLSTLVGHPHGYTDENHIFPLQLQTNLVPVSTIPMPLVTISDKLWDWNPLPDASRDHNDYK
ncbi:NAC domain-containing protein 35 [Rhynchospora pubera]|uniref:NAC domain-containing protein 35 n=1 Tax=Rhynchospora pubera TaxID=906938 RepID=A0AAV8C0R7_9POAL|nr:NAC domain-containing protein 35 [Rhynchospora pubera]